jgi:hypothetical protein
LSMAAMNELWPGLRGSRRKPYRRRCRAPSVGVLTWPSSCNGSAAALAAEGPLALSRPMGSVDFR